MTEKYRFTPLHVHTEYSLLDGSAKIKDLARRAKDLGYEHLAITDHGVMYGVIDFYKACKAEGVKPIIGCEVYVAEGSRFEKEASKSAQYYHLVLLAENEEGYHNLVKLVSYGFIEGFYYKPRIDKEIMRKHSKGLIALSACIAGEVQQHLLNFSYEKAKETALEYNDIFGAGNYYLEMQKHGIADQDIINDAFKRLSKETGIPLAATNDSHYIFKEDAEAHDVLLCVQTLKTIDDEDRMKYEGTEFYLKSPEEMYKLFPDVPEALKNTYDIGLRCNVDFEFNNYKLPKFELPEGEDNGPEYLRKLCESGLAKRYKNVTEGLKSRLDYELSVIISMGFCDYFLITWDFIRFAREKGIMVGPGRGSGAGSVVAYSLGITNIDPIKYNLIFERFLNPDRISMPDFDIDFCYERRQEVIDYVIEKYGASHVAQIITFGTMGARNAIRDVGRAMAYSYADVDRVAKMIPFMLSITIEKAMNINPELKKAYDTEDDTKKLIDMSMKLEGLPRHASTHAAGVVISDKPVMDYVPLNYNDGVITTQFPMTTVEELGLLKMDFLGLRTLTIIRHALEQIKISYGKDIDIDSIGDDDPAVYEMISQARTEGVFQLESSGMKSFMKDLKPESLDDIIAGISLYRPGPMESIPKYVAAKNGGSEIKYTHPKLEPILKNTYGCIVYQEQVMEIVRELAGYSLSRSDLIRRAMSKKKADVMAQERKNFIFGLGDDVPGCIKNGIPQAIGERIFDEMTSFAQYAFNKSHAAAYAVTCYQTAWLKLYYPVQFMAALMGSVMDQASKVAEYIDECKKMGVRLLPPDINTGYASFSVEGDGIRFGLSAIKNVGRGAVNAITGERDKNGPFVSLTEFINRMADKDVNKRCIEGLIRAGAFDSFGGTRRQYLECYPQVLSGAGANKKRNIEGQINLFEMITDDSSDILKDSFPDIAEYPASEILAMEKEVLGIYLSGHPLSEYIEVLDSFVSAASKDFITKAEEESEGIASESGLHDGKVVTVGGIITDKSVIYTKANKPMAFITVEDMHGDVEVVVFPNIYERLLSRLSLDAVITATGRVSIKEDENAKLIANDIKFYEELIEDESKKTLWIKIVSESAEKEDDIIHILNMHKGRTPVKIHYVNSKKTIMLGRGYWVNAGDDLIRSLSGILGEGTVLVK